MAITNYIWDPETDSYLMETDGSNVTQAVYTTEPKQYGGLVSQRRSGTTNYCHCDVLGSTRQLTNSIQVATDSMTYDAWGNSVAHTGAATLPFGWLGAFGYYKDVEMDAVYVRRRTFAPTVARWTSFDPLGFIESINRYLYARNNPGTLMDPSGLACKDRPSDIVHEPRGRFGYISLERRDPTEGDRGEQDTLYRIGSSFNLKWSPARGSMGNNWSDTCGCCCNTVGYIQIVRGNHPYLWRMSPWHIDNAIPYPFADTFNPCTTTEGQAILDLRDAPNFPYLHRRQGPRVFAQFFETCVFCLNGREGLQTELSFYPGLSVKKVTGITIYGCIQWGHEYRQTPGVWHSNITVNRPEEYELLQRYVIHDHGIHRFDADGNVTIQSTRNQVIRGLPPSDDFKTVIRQYLETFPIHGNP